MIKHNIDIVRSAWRYSHSQTHAARAGHGRPGGAGQLTARELRSEVLALLG